MAGRPAGGSLASLNRRGNAPVAAYGVFANNWRITAAAMASATWPLLNPGSRRRLRRLLVDARAATNLRAWLPVLVASSLFSGAVISFYALQSERYKNELLRRFGEERVSAIAANLENETEDWAIWQETILHATGRNPDYYGKGNYTAKTFARTPLVAVLDRRGDPVSMNTWDLVRDRLTPLSSLQRQQLLALLPERRSLKPRTFLAIFSGRPYLIALQPIRPEGQSGPVVGRLMFVRRLDNNDSRILRHAFDLGAFEFELVHRPPATAGLLGPIEVVIPHPQLQGLQPIQQTVRRSPRERISALWSLGLLLLLNVLLLAVLVVRATSERRRFTRLRLRQLRQERQLRRALHRRDNIDGLTGLLNDHGLGAAMKRQQVDYPGYARALVHINLNHFALINNSFGRNAGDQVLIEVAAWLQCRLPKGAVVSRGSGDQYVCSLVSSSASELRSEISAIIHELNQLEFRIEDHLIHVSVSSGARFLHDLADDKALHEAEVACDMARIAGHDSCHFFGDEQARISNHLAIQRLNQDLLSAIHDRRIELFGQPAWRLCDQLPSVYVELFSRIHDPAANSFLWSEELVEAATFCGSMALLDAHVLELACARLAHIFAVPQLRHQLENVVFAVNITPDTLLGDRFLPTVERLLAVHDIPAHSFCFEITEQAALRNRSQAVVVIKQLRAMNVRVALDDFGAGMTSLSYLRDLPLDYVKIDKSFISRVGSDMSCRLMVEFVVRLGRELGFAIVAEGVDSAQLLVLLREMEVTIAQGYVIAHPTPFDPQALSPVFSRAGRQAIEQLLHPLS